MSNKDLIDALRYIKLSIRAIKKNIKIIKKEISTNVIYVYLAHVHII